MTYEQAKSQPNEAAEAIERVIADLGIDTRRLSELAPRHRIDYLKEAIPESSQIHIKPSVTEHLSTASRKSLILVKPEIFPHDEELIDDIVRRGYDITSDPELVYPTAKQWFELYGYMVPKYPNILQNYIVHRALGFKIVTLDEMDQERISYLDSITGKAYEDNPDTLRGNITRSIMKRLGFQAMTGYASAFDPFDIIDSSGQPDYAFHCYNGIHTPKNSAEAVSNLRTFNVTE